MQSLTTAIIAFLVVVYAVVGGVIFHLLESDNETIIQRDVSNRLAVFLGKDNLTTFFQFSYSIFKK